MRIVVGDDDRVAGWVAERTGAGRYWPPFRAIGFEREGQLVAGVVFTEHNGANVEVSVAGRFCFSRVARAFLYRYTFEQLGCRRVTIRTRASNRRVLSIVPRLGFRPEGRQAAFYPDGEDALLFALFPQG